MNSQIDDYYPYKNRVEHDFANKMTVDIAKIYKALDTLKEDIHKHIDTTSTTFRKEDN